MIPEEKLDEDTPETRRHQSYINKCKKAAWKRWKKNIRDPLEKGTIWCITQREDRSGRCGLNQRGREKERKVEHWDSGRIIQG